MTKDVHCKCVICDHLQIESEGIYEWTCQECGKTYVFPEAKLHLAVVGSRTWNHIDKIQKVLDTYPEFVLVSGGATGADSIAEAYVDDKGYQKLIFKPDWEKYGRAAGIYRNAEIIQNAHILLAFWDGKSKGTLNSIERALKADNVKEVRVFKHV